MTLWSARVERTLSAEVWEFLRADDADLLQYDCEATALHARRLNAAGLLTDDELDEAEEALARVGMEGGVEETDEDIHSAIERLLGPLGRKIHASGARNGQGSAGRRLSVHDAGGQAVDGVRGVE